MAEDEKKSVVDQVGNATRWSAESHPDPNQGVSNGSLQLVATIAVVGVLLILAAVVSLFDGTAGLVLLVLAIIAGVLLGKNTKKEASNHRVEQILSEDSSFKAKELKDLENKYK